eukprot:scaffold60930_cov68-Phaeocystis_antarctica.AAC.1
MAPMLTSQKQELTTCRHSWVSAVHMRRKAARLRMSCGCPAACSTAACCAAACSVAAISCSAAAIDPGGASGRVARWRAAARLAMPFQVASPTARRRALHVMRRAIASAAVRWTAISSTASSASRVASVKGMSSMLRLARDTAITIERAETLHERSLGEAYSRPAHGGLSTENAVHPPYNGTRSDQKHVQRKHGNRARVAPGTLPSLRGAGRASVQPVRAAWLERVHNSTPLLGLDEVVQALDDLGALDDISLLEIGEEARALSGVAEARVPPVEQVLAGGGQVGVEEQPEELYGIYAVGTPWAGTWRAVATRLRRARVGVVLATRHAERPVGVERQGGCIPPTAVVIEGRAVDRALVVLDEDLERHRVGAGVRARARARAGAGAGARAGARGSAPCPSPGARSRRPCPAPPGWGRRSGRRSRHSSGSSCRCRSPC